MHVHHQLHSPELLVGEYRRLPPDPHALGYVPDSVLQLEVGSRYQLVHEEAVVRDTATPNATSSHYTQKESHCSAVVYTCTCGIQLVAWFYSCLFVCCPAYINIIIAMVTV